MMGQGLRVTLQHACIEAGIATAAAPKSTRVLTSYRKRPKHGQPQAVCQILSSYIYISLTNRGPSLSSNGNNRHGLLGMGPSGMKGIPGSSYYQAAHNSRSVRFGKSPLPRLGRPRAFKSALSVDPAVFHRVPTAELLDPAGPLLDKNCVSFSERSLFTFHFSLVLLPACAWSLACCTFV